MIYWWGHALEAEDKSKRTPKQPLPSSLPRFNRFGSRSHLPERRGEDLLGDVLNLV